MENLEAFIQKINGFDNLKASEQIKFFIYFLTINDDSWVLPRDINNCFDKLHLQPYSNISSYMSKFSSGKNAIFIKSKLGYKLTRQAQKEISNIMGECISISVSDELFPLDILRNTQYYLEKIGFQMCACYEAGLYDASLVMMRKLLETLIIECFERYNIENEIKDNNGNFFYLSDLIPKFINSNKWNVSRNLSSYIKEVKKYGDLSAHNRRFFAHKSDFDKFKFELRQTVQEIVLLIDYPNWNKSA